MRFLFESCKLITILRSMMNVNEVSTSSWHTEGWDCNLGFGAWNIVFGNNGLGGFLGPNWKVFHHWTHMFYFRGFVDLVILLSLLSSYVMFVLKVAWLAHVTLRKNNKTQAAVAPLYFGSLHAHNTRKESADSSRKNVAGAILYCHRYKRSYGWVHRWGSFYFSWHGDENDRCSRYPGKQLWNR